MRSRLWKSLAGAVFGSMLFAATAGAATITVNTVADTSAVDCTLRDAITAANTNSATGSVHGRFGHGHHRRHAAGIATLHPSASERAA